MRILVTPQGTQFVSEIEEMSNTVQSRFTNAIGTSRNFSTSHYKPHFTNTFKTHRNRFKSSSNTNTSFYKTKSRSNSKPEASTEYIDTEKTTFTRGELKQAKHINLKMTKISFPKNFVEKYEKDSKEENDSLKTTIEGLKNCLNTELPNLNAKIDEENNERGNNIKHLVEEMNQQFGEVHDLIDDERKKREESENAFVKNLEEIMEKVKNEFSKETKQREDFEENVFNLIEDTCTKLATSNLDN